MKMQSVKIFIVFITVLTVTNNLKAQTENTGERLITQLKNGTVPGWQFARNVSASSPAESGSNNMEKKESLIMQIRKGTAPGMKFMPVSTEAPATMRTVISQKTMAAASEPLASEQEIKKEVKSVATPHIIPSQEETKNETPGGKQ